MSDAVILSLVAAIVPTLTVFLTWISSRQKIQEVHRIVNSRLDAALNSIEGLKKEVVRLNRAGASPTPATAPPAAITLAPDGSVTVEKKPPAAPAVDPDAPKGPA